MKFELASCIFISVFFGFAQISHQVAIFPDQTRNPEFQDKAVQEDRAGDLKAIIKALVNVGNVSYAAWAKETDAVVKNDTEILLLPIMTAVNNSILSLSTNATVVEGEIRDSNVKMDYLRKGEERLDREISDLEALLSTSTFPEFARIRDDVDRVEKTLTAAIQFSGESVTQTLTTRIDNLHLEVGRKIDKLTGNVDKLTENVDKLTGNVDKLTGNVDKLTENVDKLTGNVDKLTGDVEILRNDGATVKSDIGYLKSDVSELRKGMTQFGSQFSSLEDKFVGLSGSLNNLTQVVADLARRIPIPPPHPSQ